MKVHCEYCHNELNRKPSLIKKHKFHFCSKECQGKFKTHEGRVALICQECGKIYKRVKSWQNKTKSLFCSYKCSGKAHSGCQHYNWQEDFPICLDCGCKVSQRKSVRCKKCSNKHFCGAQHWFYKTGISSHEILLRVQNKGILWRKKVLLNFKYTCCKCNQHGGKLVVHHLEGYHWCKSLRFEPTNGVCLCRKCHKEFHNKFGTNWITTEKFVKFLGNV